MIFFVDNAKGPTEKFLEVISKFSKITDYKESHFFPCMPSMNSWNYKLENLYHVQLHQKLKCLGIIPTKYVQDLHFNNYKTLLKKCKEDRLKWRNILYSQIGGLKMKIVPILISFLGNHHHKNPINLLK